MNTMNDLEVIINNKRYTISGYESEEYLQKIASHINSKYAQFRTHENYNHMDSEIRNLQSLKPTLFFQKFQNKLTSLTITTKPSARNPIWKQNWNGRKRSCLR